MIDQVPDVGKMDRHELSDWNAAQSKINVFHRGVTVSVRVDSLNTYIEVRQQGEGFADGGGTLVSFTRVPRSTQEPVPYQVIAQYLLLCVQRAADDGWKVLRS